VAWRTLDAGPRTNQSTADASRALIGAKGTIFGKWDYDAALLHAESKATERYVSGLLSESKLLNSTGLPADPGYVAGKLNPNINPFGLNDAAGVALLQAAQITAPTRISISKLDSIDGHVSGELMQLPAGALSVSIGAEHHTEKYNDQPQAVLNGGDVIGGGGNQLPVNAKRDVSAIFGELSAPVVKGLDALVQFRYDSYSDFGNTTNPKVGLRFQPMPELLVRASVGTGFRAPALPELYLPETQTNLGANLNDPFYEAKVGPCYKPDGTPSVNFNVQYCNAQLTAHNGGNPKLGPEKSRQRTIGFVLQPTKDLSINVDFWRIKVDGQVGVSDGSTAMCNFIAQFLVDPTTCDQTDKAQLSAAGKAALLAGATQPGIHISPTTGYLAWIDQLYANISSVKTSGVDLGWRSTIARTESGKFSSSGDISYIASQKQDGIEYAGRYLSFGPVIRTKGTLGFDWEQGAWDAGLTYRFQSSYQDAGGARKVGAYETIDLALEYKGIKNLKLRAGFINIFDRAPPFSRQSQYFQVGYDPTYANPLGRTLVIGANYKFK
jgi:iron complex outermembrane receptor protein